MSKTDTLYVVAAVADKHQVILYLQDGNTLTIKQSDHRLRDLLDAIIPITTKGEVAVISLKDFSVYRAYEEKSSVVKFFRIAKDKLSSFFGSKHTEPVVLDTEIQKELVAAIEQTRPPATVEEVIEQASEITDDVIKSDETVIAVVDNKIIPGVEQIQPLIDHAVRHNDTEAVNNFLKRCAAIIDKRQHTVEDLLRFLERGDLPLALDGSIIAYKVLRRQNDYFVDCHTGRVPQKVGSYVRVEESLVDLNRRNECSSGLHIARRGYIRGFGGDVCVLCKIDPEDVMVVPHNDPDKVRVKGYHILNLLSNEAYGLLKQNRPMTEMPEARHLVAEAIAGRHIPRLEIVTIGASLGGNISIQKTDAGLAMLESDAVVSKAAAAALDEEKSNIAVEPREINKRINEELAKQGIIGQQASITIIDDVEPVYTPADEPVKAEPAVQKAQEKRERKAAKRAADAAKQKPKPAQKAAKPVSGAPKKTQAQTAREIFDSGDMTALRDFKKKAKKGWDVLGFNAKEIKKILAND